MTQAMKDEAREIRRKMRQLQETTNAPAVSKSAAASKPRVVEHKQEPIQRIERRQEPIKKVERKKEPIQRVERRQEPTKKVGRKQEPIQRVERVQREVPASKPRVGRPANVREERSFVPKKSLRADVWKQPEIKAVATAQPLSNLQVSSPVNNVQEATNSHAAAWLEQQKQKMRAQFELNKLNPEAFKRQYEPVLSPNSKQEKVTADITEQTWLQKRKAAARADCQAQRTAIDAHFNTMLAGVVIMDENAEPENVLDASPVRRMIDKANATFGRI